MATTLTQSFQRAATTLSNRVAPSTSVKTAISNVAKTTTTSALTASFSTVFKAVAQVKTLASSVLTQVKPVTTQAPVQTVSLKKDIKLAVPNLIQGKNECGPTSLAMALKYYGITADPHKIFSSSTVGHGPNALMEKAAAYGMTCRQQNYGELTDLKAMIDKGIPVLTLGIYGGGTNSSITNYIDNASKAHWMTVTGYKTDAAGKITHIYFNNPNQSTTQCWTASDFLTKFWNNNIIPGGHRYYIAMAPKNSFKESLLKAYLPTNKISSAFSTTLKIIDGLEDAFYAAEKAADKVASTVGNAVYTIADAAEDAWDEVTSWFT